MLLPIHATIQDANRMLNQLGGEGNIYARSLGVALERLNVLEISLSTLYLGTLLIHVPVASLAVKSS